MLFRYWTKYYNTKMSIIIKSAQEIQAMRESGQILAYVLEETCKMAKAGISTLELDRFAEKLIRQNGGTPAFKGYHGFPATLCTNIDEVVVHGIPSAKDILKEGDLLTIDCGVFLKGLCTDSARTVAIGNISPEKNRLLKTANEALYSGIDAAISGKNLHRIGETIQKIVEKAGFHVVYDLTGHGVGRKLHEDPTVYNYAQNTPGPILKPGMTLAIEPIFAVGTSQIETLPDDWTIVTVDGSCSIQEEHTILITENGPEILTQLK